MSFANTHTFFCCELECSAEAHVFGGRCDDCFEAYITQLRKDHNPLRCEWCCARSLTLELSNSGRFCSKRCEADYIEDHACDGIWDDVLECYNCMQCRSCYTRHKCSPIHVDNGHVDYYDCDDADSPTCPQNRKPTKCCADCGCAPDDGYFSCYRGNEPLCPDCEEVTYGPRSPDDWRARSGACNKCGYHYMLICSSDRTDLCYSCKKLQR